MILTGMRVYHDPTKSGKPPKDCIPVLSLSQLCVGERVYIETLDPNTWTDAQVMMLDDCPTLKSGGVGVFIEDTGDGVTTHSSFSYEAINRIQFDSEGCYTDPDQNIKFCLYAAPKSWFTFIFTGWYLLALRDSEDAIREATQSAKAYHNAENHLFKIIKWDLQRKSPILTNFYRTPKSEFLEEIPYYE